MSTVRLIEEVEENCEEIHPFQQRLREASANFQLRRSNYPIGTAQLYRQREQWQPTRRSVSSVAQELWGQFREEMSTMSVARSAMMIMSITLLMLIIGFIGLLTTRSASCTRNSDTKKDDPQSGNAPDDSPFSMGF